MVGACRCHRGTRPQPGIFPFQYVFDAAIDGLGVALGRSIMVDDDLAADRLVKPFNLLLKAEFAYYLVCPPTHVARPKVKAFRDWVFDEVARDAARAAA